MHRLKSPIVVLLIQGLLSLEVVTGIVTGTWTAVFVALLTLGLTMLPGWFAAFMGVTLPRSVLSAIVIFIFATLFLGEVGDFYERFWWWDVALHFGSALSFSAVAFLLILMLFEGDRYAAPPWALAVLSACVAIAIGAIWEIFEFSMDQFFDMNMQKSGLIDTMTDLIIDTTGAALGAVTAFLFLKGRELGGIGHAMAEFVQLNQRLFRRAPRNGPK